MKLLDWLRPRPNTLPHRFHGGLAIPGHKAQSTQQPSNALPILPHYILSLRQRNGLLQTPIVAVGEHVLRGQIITRENGAGSVPRHAPTSGTILAISEHPDIHPSQAPAPAMVIAADGEDRAVPALPAWHDYLQHSAAELLARIHECGISGLGGAGFPTARKLKHPTRTLIINAAECEPYITCDDMQIREHPAAIVSGAQIAAHILGADAIHFGIEDDKPHAIAALQQAITDAADPRIHLTAVPTRYPSGNSRQLFELLLGIRVPADRHAAEYGLICHNSATIKAIHDAVLLGQPLIERYVTLSGEALARPQVVRARFGTPLDALIAHAGGTTQTARCIIGGPMMGHPQQQLSAGLKKTSNCILLLPEQPAPREENCIRCAHCADACPMELLPQQLYWYSRNHDGKRLEQYRLFDCIECGICASVCPSAIPLVDYYKHSKAALRDDARKSQAAAHAQTRHQAREARLLREAQEREAKMAAKRARLQQPAASDTASTTAPFNPTENNSPDPQKTDAIAAAKARAEARKAARLAQQQSADTPADPTTDRRVGFSPPAEPTADSASDRHADRRVGFSPPAEPESTTDPLAAAKARAEARKAARLAQQQSADTSADPTTDRRVGFSPPAEPESTTDPLAAAKARAEARKAARLQTRNPPDNPDA